MNGTVYEVSNVAPINIHLKCANWNTMCENIAIDLTYRHAYLLHLVVEKENNLGKTLRTHKQGNSKWLAHEFSILGKHGKAWKTKPGKKPWRSIFQKLLYLCQTGIWYVMIYIRNKQSRYRFGLMNDDNYKFNGVF